MDATSPVKSPQQPLQVVAPRCGTRPAALGVRVKAMAAMAPRGGEAVTSSCRNLAEFCWIILEVSANEFLITVLHRLSFHSYLISRNSLTLGPFGNLLTKFNLLLWFNLGGTYTSTRQNMTNNNCINTHNIAKTFLKIPGAISLSSNTFLGCQCHASWWWISVVMIVM